MWKTKHEASSMTSYPPALTASLEPEWKTKRFGPVTTLPFTHHFPLAPAVWGTDRLILYWEHGAAAATPQGTPHTGTSVSYMRPSGFAPSHRIAWRPQLISLSRVFNLTLDADDALVPLIVLLALGPCTLTGPILKWNQESRFEWNSHRNFAIGFAAQRNTSPSQQGARLKICLGNDVHVAEGVLLLLRHTAFCKQLFFPRNAQKPYQIHAH